MNEVDCCFAVDWMQASKQEFQFSNCRRTLHFDGVVVVMIISRFTIHYLISLIYSFAVCTISSHCLDQKEEVRFFINGWLRNEKRHKLNSCFISTNREIWQHRERARTRENLFSNKCYTLLWMISYFFSSNNNKNNSFSLCFRFWGSLFFSLVTFCHKFTHTRTISTKLCGILAPAHHKIYYFTTLHSCNLFFLFDFTSFGYCIIAGTKI